MKPFRNSLVPLKDHSRYTYPVGLNSLLDLLYHLGLITRDEYVSFLIGK